MISPRFIADYFRHLLFAKTRHGVHSPFVYRLVDKVIYNFTPGEVYSQVERLRSELLKDDRYITITDLGAGSHLNNNRQKQIKQLARNALKPPRLAQLIYRLAKEFKPRNIIELGTCLGITTSYLSKAAPEAEICTIEGCPQTAAIASETLSKAGAGNVKQLTGNFDAIFPGIVSQGDSLDFVFIDGNHRKQATIDYFNQCLLKVNENSVLIFDDIYWSRGMKEAWAQVREHPRVSVTIDLFWIGLVFFRKGQEKEHFRIRF